MTALERAEAKLLVDEMLCKRVTERTIVTALVEEYSIGEPAARKLLRDATKEMQAAVAEAMPHRRAQQIASLDRLYERALDKGKLGTAVAVQRLLAKIEGTEKPTKHQHTGIPAPAAAAGAAAGDPEFEGRSVEELDYYAEHGYWADEAPDDGGDKAEDYNTPDFPLQ